MKENYIKAVLGMIHSGKDTDVILSGLKKTLEARGHDRLYASVLSGVVRVLEAGSADSVTATVASEADYKTHTTAIKNALLELGTSDVPAVQIDETIVGGFVAEANDRRIDASYKSKLVTLYRSLTR